MHCDQWHTYERFMTDAKLFFPSDFSLLRSAVKSVYLARGAIAHQGVGWQKIDSALAIRIFVPPAR